MKKTNISGTFFLLLFFMLSFHAQAQKTGISQVKPDTSVLTPSLNKSVYLELGGPGLAAGINYDTRFGNVRNGWGYRIGMAYFARNGNTVFTVPFQFNYLFGNSKSFFELGEGATYVKSRGSTHDNFFQFDNITGFIATATFGYRYQPNVKGVNFRIAFTPIFYDEGLVPAGGVSVGYTF